MPEVLFRVRAVMANRLWRAAWLAYTLLQLSLLWFPVARIPGYELATGLSLITAVFGGAFGVAFGRQESMRNAAAPLGQVVLATLGAALTLVTPPALAWGETSVSGQPLVGAPGSGSLGALQSGAVEESNVDLTGELVNMIVQQRNYQANAQSIKTQDQIMQTLVNIR